VKEFCKSATNCEHESNFASVTPVDILVVSAKVKNHGVSRALAAHVMVHPVPPSVSGDEPFADNFEAVDYSISSADFDVHTFSYAGSNLTLVRGNQLRMGVSESLRFNNHKMPSTYLLQTLGRHRVANNVMNCDDRNLPDCRLCATRARRR
jgi:hypothetical protein